MPQSRELLAHGVATALTAGTARLTLALALVFVLTGWHRNVAEVAVTGAVRQPLPANGSAQRVDEVRAEARR